jgi:hypothetical protein
VCLISLVSDYGLYFMELTRAADCAIRVMMPQPAQAEGTVLSRPALNRCLVPGPGCNRRDHREMHPIRAEAQEAMLAVLRRARISELVARQGTAWPFHPQPILNSKPQSGAQPSKATAMGNRAGHTK